MFESLAHAIPHATAIEPEAAPLPPMFEAISKPVQVASILQAICESPIQSSEQAHQLCRNLS